MMVTEYTLASYVCIQCEILYYVYRDTQPFTKEICLKYKLFVFQAWISCVNYEYGNHDLQGWMYREGGD